MVPAPVGHHCPTCIQEARQDAERARGVRWSGGQGTKTGVVVKALIVLSVIAFAYQSSDYALVTLNYGNIPLYVDSGEYYRLVTATFMHANISHLLLNMLGLWIIGSMLEPVLGRVRFLVLYLVAGIGGSVAYDVFGTANVPAIGASTAVFGLFGAAFVIAKSRGGDTRTIITLIVINLLFGLLVPGIDNYGHLGGLVTGAAVAGVFELSEKWRHFTRLAVQVGGVALVLVSLGITVAQIEPRAERAASPSGFLSLSVGSLSVETGGGSQDGRAAGERADGVPLWEDSRLAPPACRVSCRQVGPRT